MPAENQQMYGILVQELDHQNQPKKAACCHLILFSWMPAIRKPGNQALNPCARPRCHTCFPKGLIVMKQLGDCLKDRLDVEYLPPLSESL